MTWAIPGGSLLPDESYLDAAIRETLEETGHNLSSAPNKLIYTHETDWPRTIYKTYALVVDKPFKPVLDWESIDYKWCTMDEMPAPLHPGIEAMFSHDRSAEILHEWLTNLTNS
jgi:8-oxo-dGTP pyrophosphatase MutT (NUDIX family)